MNDGLDPFRAKRAFVCDMDGVIYHGNRLLPGAETFVAWLHREAKEFLFLTNSSERTPRELREKLKRLGIDVEERHFYTSALATAAFPEATPRGPSRFARDPGKGSRKERGRGPAQPRRVAGGRKARSSRSVSSGHSSCGVWPQSSARPRTSSAFSRQVSSTS